MAGRVLMALIVPHAALGAAFMSTLKPALEILNSAWEAYAGPAGLKWPPVTMNIKEPSIGVKTTPAGKDPLTYLEELPELKHYVVADAKIAYDWGGVSRSITCQSDWTTFFGVKRTGLDVALDLWFTAPMSQEQGIWGRTIKAAELVSQKLRSFGKSLIMGEDVELDDLKKESDYLEKQGFSNFTSKGLIFEELGITKEDRPGLIDELVEAGIPQVWGKTLKRAAGAKRGSVKSLTANSYAGGIRTIYYMKLQVLPDGDGGVDGFFAIYKLDASTDAEKTSIGIQRSFDRYVELEAHQKWKKEVRQFLPGDGQGRESGRESEEL